MQDAMQGQGSDSRLTGGSFCMQLFLTFTTLHSIATGRRTSKKLRIQDIDDILPTQWPQNLMTFCNVLIGKSLYWALRYPN